MRRLVLIAATAALAVPAPAALASGRHAAATTIALPDGVAPEGIAATPRGTLYVGSLADGRIVRGDVRRGTFAPFVTAPATPVTVGIALDRRQRLLAAAGGPSGLAAIYDARTGATVRALTLTTAPSFINDVIVTRRAAWFTNSQSPELYRVPIGRHGEVGDPVTVPLSGPAAAFVDGFNLNGIEATRDGRWLISVNSTTGALFRIDPRSGASIAIDLGGASASAGDGLWLAGRRLYVVRNQLNEIAVFALDRHLRSARLVRTITSPLFEVPTTMALTRGRLVAVNAQFGLAQPNPFEVVVLPERGLRGHRGR